MKKPDPEFAIIKLSLEAWRDEMAKQDANPEDIALQETKDEISRLHRKELAGRVYQAIKDCKFTKRQLEVFSLYVDNPSYVEVAKKIGKTKVYVFRVVDKIRKRVLVKLGEVVNQSA